MRILLHILIIIHIYCDINIPWKFNFNDIVNTLDNFADKLKTTSSLYFSEIQQKLNDFKTYTEEKKDEIIKDTKNELDEIYKNYKKEKNKYVKAFIEKSTELSNLLSYKICDITKIDTYENCRNDKKKVFTKILDKLKEEFQCSQIFNFITTDLLSNDYENNLKNILFLLSSITFNYDSLEKGKSYIIYDLTNCLQEKYEKFMPIVLKKLEVQSQDYVYSFKIDINNLLIKCISNLVNIIHFEEIDGYITKINKKTGLISSEKAIKIQQNIFKALTKLNEFGKKFYNISNNLYLNVDINPGNLDANADLEMQIFDFKDKGIKIKLHSNFLLRLTGAHYIQTVVFDSPLVSIRGGTRINLGGTSNIFVGITLYDENGKEIIVKDINIDKFRPIIYYKKQLFNSMTNCLFFNEVENTIENTGIKTEAMFYNGEEYIKCIPNHLTTFTIGSYKEVKILDSSERINKIILSLIGFIALIL